MAFTKSGLFYLTFRDALSSQVSQIVLNMALDTHKIAIYDSVEDPNYSTDAAYSATNEVSGTNWAAGGVVVTSADFLAASGDVILAWDAVDVSEANTTIVTDTDGAIIYADALATNNLIVGIQYPVGDYTTSAGTYGVTFDAAGVFTIDLTP